MPTPKEPVNCLVKFIDRISENRQSWGLPKHKELSFRDESKNYGDTILRPELYRPPNVGAPLKPISELLNLNWTVNSPSGSTTLCRFRNHRLGFWQHWKASRYSLQERFVKEQRADSHPTHACGLAWRKTKSAFASTRQNSNFLCEKLCSSPSFFLLRSALPGSIKHRRQPPVRTRQQ